MNDIFNMDHFGNHTVLHKQELLKVHLAQIMQTLPGY